MDMIPFHGIVNTLLPAAAMSARIHTTRYSMVDVAARFLSGAVKAHTAALLNLASTT